MGIYNIYSMLEGILLIWLYFLMHGDEKKRKQYYALIFVYFLIFIGSTYYRGSLEKNNAIINTLECAIMTGLSVRYFLALINNLEIPLLTNYYLFWLNSAVLVYFAGGFFVFLVTNYFFIHATKTPIANLWIIHGVLNVAYNILMTKSIYTWRINN